MKKKLSKQRHLEEFSTEAYCICGICSCPGIGCDPPHWPQGLRQAQLFNIRSLDQHRNTGT
jgi:putative bacteriocin precursor